MATGYAYRVFGTPTDAKKWTFSAWVKRAKSGTYHIFGGGATGQTGDGHSYLGLIPEFYAVYYDGSSSIWNLYSNPKYQDITGWYHYVFTYDSAQSTASNRAKCYINGEQVTSFSTETYPSLNYSTMWNNSGITHYLGRRGQSQNFDGCMSHVHFCDGYAYAPSDFGSTDSTTGEWKINTTPSVSYGNNGFWLFKDDASVTDQSGNGNNFTLSGSITPTQDNPSNNFATGNSLNERFAGSAVLKPTYSQGGLTYTGTDPSYGTPATSTLVMNKGKFYAEFKISAVSNGNYRIGVVPLAQWNNQAWMFGVGYAYHENGTKEHDGANTAYGASLTTNDIVGIAFDVDNGAIWFSKNGTWQNSATISEIAAGTTTNAAFSSITTSGLDWAFVPTPLNNDVIQANYGNGYFGSTAVSSAGTNASNIGIFEYDVPTGFTALCTKGLNE